MNNWTSLLICLLYVFGMIGAAEWLRRWRRYSSDFTRKIVHIGVGMLSWAVPLLFDSPWYFVGACVLFMIINWLDWRHGFFAAMASSDRSNLGTVYFPFMAALVALLFWDRPPLMVAALMPLTWGDGLAPIVGRRFGRHTYSIHVSQRSLEGSAGFFVAAFIFTWLALWSIPGSPGVAWEAALWPSLVIVAATTIVEAITIWGLDNITVTAVAASLLGTWPF